MTTRRRLTAATLDEQEKTETGGHAVDIATKLLGPAATDKEIVTASRMLLNGLDPRNLSSLHRMASRVAAEAGDQFAATEDDDPEQPDPRDTQEYVAEHELTPDHAVLDVVMNERTPTQNPTARRRKAADDDDNEDESSLENPDEVEADAEDHVDEDDLENDTEDASNAMDEVQDEMDDVQEEMEGEGDGDLDEDLQDLEEDTDHLEDEAGDLENDADNADGDVNLDDITDVDSVPASAEGDDDDEEFTMEDMEDLEDAGVDGVLTSSLKRGRKKGPKSKKTAKQQFRPSRVRIASTEDSDNEFDRVFPDQEDVSKYFRD